MAEEQNQGSNQEENVASNDLNQTQNNFESAEIPASSEASNSVELPKEESPETPLLQEKKIETNEEATPLIPEPLVEEAKTQAVEPTPPAETLSSSTTSESEALKTNVPDVEEKTISTAPPKEEKAGLKLAPDASRVAVSDTSSLGPSESTKAISIVSKEFTTLVNEANASIDNTSIAEKATVLSQPVGSPVQEEKIQQNKEKTESGSASQKIEPSPTIVKGAKMEQNQATDDLSQVKKLKDAYDTIRSEVGKVIVGMDEVVEELLICIFSRGHCLLIGVPGLAKTLLISTLAKTLNLSFNRIQFTPDLMPADITGTEVIQEEKGTGNRVFKFLKGPIFANVILADEINRTPPKTQAALLEAMQEHQVSAGGQRHPLEQPFFVLATQNPIEQEGTYPLPEAQLDRFMFNTFVNYPTEREEFEVMKRTTAEYKAELKQIMSGEEIIELQNIVRRVPISDQVIEYAMSFSRATRITQPEAPDFIKKWLTWGAGPRASQYLILGGKARALLQGRFAVTTEDIQKVAYPVLRHRLITNFSAEAEGITTDKIIDKLIETLPRHESETLKDGKLPKVFGS